MFIGFTPLDILSSPETDATRGILRTAWTRRIYLALLPSGVLRSLSTACAGSLKELPKRRP